MKKAWWIIGVLAIIVILLLIFIFLNKQVVVNVLNNNNISSINNDNETNVIINEVNSFGSGKTCISDGQCVVNQCRLERCEKCWVRCPGGEKGDTGILGSSANPGTCQICKPGA